MTNFSQELYDALQAARLGADPIRELFGRNIGFSTKEDKSIVTKADKASEDAIINYLRGKSPYGILSEEAGASGETSGPQWVIDPLDGTTNFAQGLPLFAVSIALVEGDHVQIGVIVDPISGDEYYAQADNGAYKNGKKLWRKEFSGDNTPVIINEHGYAPKNRKLYAKVTTRVIEKAYVRTVGASTTELCYVANGSADAFVCSGDKLWDVAAGVLICKEAGYSISDWKGNPWNSTTRYELVCHPDYFDMLVGKLADLQE